MLHLISFEPSFPLTLTLSPREREQQPPGVCFAHTLDFGASLELGAWNLELLRCLALGIWRF